MVAQIPLPFLLVAHFSVAQICIALFSVAHFAIYRDTIDRTYAVLHVLHYQSMSVQRKKLTILSGKLEQYSERHLQCHTKDFPITVSYQPVNIAPSWHANQNIIANMLAYLIYESIALCFFNIVQKGQFWTISLQPQTKRGYIMNDLSYLSGIWPAWSSPVL